LAGSFVGPTQAPFTAHFTTEVGAVVVGGGESGVAAVDPDGGGMTVVNGVDVLETVVGPPFVVVTTGEPCTGPPIGYCFAGPPIAVCFLGPPTALCAKAGVETLADTPRNTTSMTAPLFMALPFRQLATGDGGIIHRSSAQGVPVVAPECLRPPYACFFARIKSLNRLNK
jgi:hypothetical protein